MEQKKPTNAQLLKRINKAVVHIDRTKDTKEIYFSDKGLRLVVCDDVVVIETGFHRHVFSNITSAGVSRPYLYIERLVEIALKTATTKQIKTEQGYSYARLIEVLKAKEDKMEYNIVTYIDWWLFNIFQPLYSIGETEAESFLVYESYLHNIARNAILLSEKTKDITNKQFFDGVIKNMQEFVEGIEERVIFPKKTDAKIAQENIEAIQEQMQQDAMEAQA